MKSRFVQQVAWGITVVGAVVAALLLLLPIRLPTGGAAQMVVPLALINTATAPNTSAAESIALANIFSTTRRPPATRYAPPEDDATASNVFMSPGNVSLPGAPDSLMLSGDIPRLFGTVIDPTGARALLHLNGMGGPRIYRVGERDGRYKLLSISPRAVVLSGPAGRVTLKLDPQDDRP